MLSILPTQFPTDCANIKGLCIKCISDRVRLPTDLPANCEKYGGALKNLVRNSKFTDGFWTPHWRNKCWSQLKIRPAAHGGDKLLSWRRVPDVALIEAGRISCCQWLEKKVLLFLLEGRSSATVTDTNFTPFHNLIHELRFIFIF
jgi:hypothetical protein